MIPPDSRAVETLHGCVTTTARYSQTTALSQRYHCAMNEHAAVPADAAEYLEALEDATDAIAARRALAEAGPSIPRSRSGLSSALTTSRERPAIRAGVPPGSPAATAHLGDLLYAA